MAVKKVIEIEIDDKDLKTLNKTLDSAGIKMSKVKETSKESFDAVKKGAKDSKAAVQDTGAAATALTGKLDKMTGGAITAFKGIISGARAATASMVTLTSAIAATGIGLLVVAVGALAAAFRNSEEGQNRWNRIASVTGALVGNLTDLLADLGEKIIWAFTHPKKALEDFGNFIVSQIENRVVGMFELLPQLANAVSQAFKGDFSGAMKTVADASAKVTFGVENATDKLDGAINKTKEFIEEQKKEAKAADDVAKMRNKADKIERDLLVERSELENKISELKLKSRQEDQFSAEERKKFLLEVQELEDGLLGKEMEALELRKEAQVLENTFSRSNKESLDAEAKAIAAVNDIETRRNTQKRATQRELNRVNKEIERDEKAARKEREAQEKADQKAADEKAKKAKEKRKADLKELAQAEDEFRRSKLTEQEREVEDVNRKYEKLIELAIENGQNTLVLEEAQQAALDGVKEKYDKKAQERRDKEQADKDKKRKEEEKKEEDLQKAKFALANNALGAIGAITEAFSGQNEEDAKRNFKIQKALGIASATISGIEGVQNAYTTAQKSPLTALNPAYPGIQAGLAGVFAVAKVASIARQQFNAPTSPDAGNEPGGGRVPVGPQFNLVGQGLDSQIAGGVLSSGKNQVLKAYVVEKDVTSAQELQRQIDVDSSFG